MNNKQLFKQEIKKYTPLEILMGIFSFIIGGIGGIYLVLSAWKFIEHLFAK